MDNQSIRYTIGQMIALNHGGTNVPAGMGKLFRTYVNGLPKDYNNKHNKGIPVVPPGEVKKSILSSGGNNGVYQDISVIPNIRHIFGSLAKSKTDATIKLINAIDIPITMVTEVAKLFFETCVQCPAVCDEYLNVLFRLSFPNRVEQKITYQFVQILTENYARPPVLPDSKLESAADRNKHYHAATCLLLVKLFSFPFENTEQFKNPRAYFSAVTNFEKFIKPLFEKMQGGDVNALHNAAVVYRTLKEKCPTKFDLEPYRGIIAEVYQNTSLFKLTVRLLLKDFI